VIARPLAVLLPLTVSARPPRRLGAGWLAAGLLGLLLATVGTALGAPLGTAPFSIPAALIKWTPLMARGFALNLAMSLGAMALGTVAGVALGLERISPHHWIRAAAFAVIQFFRNAPWLVLLFYSVYVLPFSIDLFGFTILLPDWLKATLGLSLPVMANIAEIVRGSIQAIPPGQWEAGRALGLDRRHILRLIILPQAIKPSIPPWMNWYAIVTMATPLASVVGVSEAVTFTGAALNAENRFDLLMPMYLYLLSWFFIYCYVIARWAQSLERRFTIYRAGH
jgi:polar amino acid transport system permease protein